VEQRDTATPFASQAGLSREDLEQHLRARAWKDDAFRQEFLTNPKSVLERDYAQSFPDGKIPLELSIKVIEEDEQTICFVLPSRFPEDHLPEMEELDEKELAVCRRKPNPPFSQSGLTPNPE